MWLVGLRVRSKRLYDMTSRIRDSLGTCIKYPYCIHGLYSKGTYTSPSVRHLIIDY